MAIDRSATRRDDNRIRSTQRISTHRFSALETDPAVREMSRRFRGH